MDENKHYTVVKMAADAPAPAYPKMTVNRSGGFVSYGPQNDFPQYIANLCGKSPVNAAIIDSTVTYVCGKGIRDSDSNADTFTSVPHAGGTWDDIIERIARDFKTFGGFYLQIIKNKDSATVSVYHQDFTTVRIGSIDDEGNPLTWVIANDWPKGNKKKRVELDTWTGIDDMEAGRQYLYHFWLYTPGLQHYCVPDWHAATDYVKADGTLAQFYNNSIDNGFTPSVVVSMPNNPSDDKKDAFQTEMEGAFSGAKGASAIVVLWGENDAVKPQITPFQASANADIYNNVEGIVFQKIISAHRLASPTLAGVSGSGNLSGNAAEIIDSYVLYNYGVVEKMRRRILDTLNIFTRINGTAVLHIDELDVLPKIRESEGGPAPAGPATLSRRGTWFNRLKSMLWK